MPTHREHRLLRYVSPRSESAGAAVESRGAEQGEVANLVRRRSRIQEKIRNYIRLTFDEMGVAGSAETNKLREALAKIDLNEQEIAGWEEGLDYYERQAPESARQLIGEFHDQLRSARAEKIVGLRGADEWVRRFHDSGKSYKQKEHMVKNAFKAWKEKAKEMKRHRDKLAALPRVKEMPPAKVPGINKLLDADTFADMKLSSQKALIAQIQAALRSKDIEKDTVYDDAHNLLKNARDAGYLHPNKVGTWLKRAMNHGDPETYVATTLPYLLKNWQAIRADYDDVAPQIVRRRPAILLTPASSSTFLSWSYDKCKTYLTEARSQLQEAEETLETDRKLKSKKLIVRHHLMTEDWDGAEEALGEAFAMAPKDPDLASMKSYLAAHRTDSEEDKKRNERPPEEIKKETDEMIAGVPVGAQDMVRTVAKAGPKAAATLGALFYNRVWAKEKGYSDEAQEVRDANDEKIHDQTKARMKTGHTDELEKSKIAGSTEDSLAINDSPANAQILHTKAGSNAQATIAQKAISNQDNGGFMYWTSVIPEGVSYAQHEYMVRNTFPALKKNLRTLEGKGIKYGESAPDQKPEADKKKEDDAPPVLAFPTATTENTEKKAA